jgi:hypothetical protein
MFTSLTNVRPLQVAGAPAPPEVVGALTGVPAVGVANGAKVGEAVRVGKSVWGGGAAIAVWVRAAENVSTAWVCTSSGLKVGVASASLPPHAVSINIPISKTKIIFCFIYTPF